MDIDKALKKMEEHSKNIDEIAKKPLYKEPTMHEPVNIEKAAEKTEPAVAEKNAVRHDIKQETVKSAEIKKETQAEKEPKIDIKKVVKAAKAAEKKSSYEQRKVFSSFIRKAGIEADFEDINKKIMLFTAIPIGVSLLVLIIKSLIDKSFFSDLMLVLFSVLVFGSLALYFVMWVGFFVFVDMTVYKRRKEVELIFPDFLQLTAANINAGMPIDRALWFAIRPKFGILAKEMELVAKATMVGENLGTALLKFSSKYDSIVIKRALNLLLEGLESGGEIGDLLVKVSNNMMETEVLKKEMASSVTTYVIFILFATLGAAPFLFGLTTELIVIMTSILSNIAVGEGTSSFGGIGSMIGGGNTVSVIDYQIFAVVSISMSCTFAAIIISVIQKGDAREALKNIPLYVIIGVGLYFLAFKTMHLLLGGFFS